MSLGYLQTSETLCSLEAFSVGTRQTIRSKFGKGFQRAFHNFEEKFKGYKEKSTKDKFSKNDHFILHTS